MKRLSAATFGSSRLLFYLSAALLIASVALGGATRPGYLSDALLQLLCVPVFLVTIARLDWLGAKRIRLPLMFLCALLAVPLLQLVPLPQSLWSALPHHEPIAFREAEEIQRRQISVAPHVTWQSFASLLVPLTIFLSVAQLDHRDRQWLSLILLAMGILGMFLALLQLLEGPNSALRFFDVTNIDEAVGFFANRNHFAALLYCLVPLAIAWFAQPTSHPPKHPHSHGIFSSISIQIAGVVLLGSLIAAQAMTQSRAGITLSLVALVGSYILAVHNRQTRSHFGVILLLACLVAGALAIDVSGVRLIERFAANPLSDARQSIAETTLTAIRAYFPLGSGMGTFSIAYAAFERPENVLPTYINRAHNDVLEWALEAGFAGVSLMVIFLIWLVVGTFRAWRSPAHHGQDTALLPRVSSLIVWLLMAHSLVDYPLRTTALMAVFAFCCALLIGPLERQSRNGAPLRDASKTQALLPPTTRAPLKDDWPDAWKKPKP